jgi:hypothetical protein
LEKGQSDLLFACHTVSAYFEFADYSDTGAGRCQSSA